jgi:hypothetical protein
MTVRTGVSKRFVEAGQHRPVAHLAVWIARLVGCVGPQPSQQRDSPHQVRIADRNGNRFAGPRIVVRRLRDGSSFFRHLFLLTHVELRKNTATPECCLRPRAVSADDPQVINLQALLVFLNLASVDAPQYRRI